MTRFGERCMSTFTTLCMHEVKSTLMWLKSGRHAVAEKACKMCVSLCTYSLQGSQLWLALKEGFFICRDRPSLPFRCLDPQYRRELVRVYLTNVEGICRRFVDEKRESLVRVKETTASFKAYWACQTAADKKALVQHKGSDMLKVRQGFASTDNRLVYCTFHGLTGSFETGV